MVAIKIIQKARFANNPKTLEMFSREITIIQQLDHVRSRSLLQPQCSIKLNDSVLDVAFLRQVLRLV